MIGGLEMLQLVYDLCPTGSGRSDRHSLTGLSGSTLINLYSADQSFPDMVTMVKPVLPISTSSIYPGHLRYHIP